MPTKKILSVDDARTVRLLVRKALKPFDVIVYEAANGQEGIAVARAEKPDLILMDVTMPELDGIEALKRLKDDPALKGIPVIMLTAEAGRDKVLAIAKLGARGYIVKPFTEQVLLDRIRGITAIDPAVDPDHDKKLLLLVEDKLPVVRQVFDAVKDPSWGWKHVASPTEALEIVGRQRTAAVVVSLALPEDAALGLLRDFRLHPNGAETAFLGLALKTATEARDRAMQSGFAATADKPIDPADLEAKLRQALQHQQGDHAVRMAEEHLLVRLTEGMTEAQIKTALDQVEKLAPEAVESGLGVAVFDLMAVQTFTAELSKFIAQAMSHCEPLGMRSVLLGPTAIAEASRAFAEAKDWQFHEKLELAGA